MYEIKALISFRHIIVVSNFPFALQKNVHILHETKRFLFKLFSLTEHVFSKEGISIENESVHMLSLIEDHS